MSTKLTLQALSNTINGTAAAFRCRTELQPAGGVGDKVFPPTYAGAVYAIEQRQIFDADGKNPQTKTCVVLDSVQAQANRMEEALQAALDAGRVKVPVLSVDFTGLGLLDEVGRVTSLEAPHRVADAILRDSLLNGQPFRKSELGKQLDAASLQNATPLYQLCPTALVFGIWDSTGPKGGLGAKFQRSLVSEIIGVNAQIGKRTGSRIDPLEIYRQAGPIFRTNEDWKEKEGDWTIDPEKAARNAKGKLILFKKTKEGEDIIIADDAKLPDQAAPSAINHGNIPPDFGRYQDNKSGTPDPVSGRDSIIKDSIAPGGVTIDHAEQTIVLSLPALRRLRFPVDGKTTVERDNAGRTVLVALALTAAALAAESGFDLRSRCLLWPTGPLTWELLATPGKPTEKLTITSEDAIALLKEAVAAAEKVGLEWQSEPIPLKPAPNMIALLKRSQEIGAKNAEANRE